MTTARGPRTLVGLAVLLSLAACSSGGGDTSGPRTAAGTVIVRSSAAGSACRPTTPPGLVQPGMEIVVFDEEDHVLGSGPLLDGHWSGYECVLPFSFSIDHGADQYKVSINGNRKHNIVGALDKIKLYAGT